MEFIETSAKKNVNIQEAFRRLAMQICHVKAQQMPSILPGSDPAPSMSLPRNGSFADKKGSHCPC